MDEHIGRQGVETPVKTWTILPARRMRDEESDEGRQTERNSDLVRIDLEAGIEVSAGKAQGKRGNPPHRPSQCRPRDREDQGQCQGECGDEQRLLPGCGHVEDPKPLALVVVGQDVPHPAVQLGRNGVGLIDLQPDCECASVACHGVQMVHHSAS